MAILSKDQIWAANDTEEREVEVPQWGGSVRVRSLTLEQIVEIRKHAVKTDRKTGREEVDSRLQMAGLLCEGIIEPAYSFEEAQRLLKKSSAATSLLVTAINELSGLSPEAVDEADKSDEPGSDAGIHVLPGIGTQNDGIRATSSDERD